jgi:hypothetical protein
LAARASARGTDELRWSEPTEPQRDLAARVAFSPLVRESNTGRASHRAGRYQVGKLP